MKVRILGSGHSGGTPTIGGRGWGNCDPENPKNRRTRPSILIHAGGGAQAKNLLVDTSPDLRFQLLEADVHEIHALIYTHAHADHLHGLDDLRAINRHMGVPIPCYTDKDTFEEIHERFEYAFKPPVTLDDGRIFFPKPSLEPHKITFETPMDISGVTVTPFHQSHGHGHTVGYRFGDFGYCTDVKEMPEKAFEILDGVKVMFVATLGWQPYPTHAHVDLALEWIDRVGPERAVLGHLSPAVDYKELDDYLPDHVVPAYDGLVINVG